MRRSWRKKETLLERFEQRVEKTDSCWLWRGSINAYGYGILTYRMKFSMAHRTSFEMFNGKIKPGMYVCHSCDNPGCVNPAHLFLGTQKDNMADCVTKGRQNKGQKNGMAKLTPGNVNKIISLARSGVIHRKIGEKFGVSRSCVGLIVNGDRWSSVKEKK